MNGKGKRLLSFWQDKRLKAICHRLSENGYEIGIAGCTLPSGMPHGTCLFQNYREEISESDIILLPLPSLRSRRIAFSEGEIPFSDFIKMIRPKAILLSGMLPSECVREAEEAGITVYDYYDSEEIGKPTGSDMREGKITLPALYVLNSSDTDFTRELLEKLAGGYTMSDAEIEKLIALTKECGGIEYAQRRIEDFRSEAIGLIPQTVSDELREALILYLDFAISRNK